MQPKTLSDLRKACAAHGIKVSKKTFSHGPSLSFEIAGRGTEGVLTREFYDANKASFEGQKVYGLKD